jgi:glucose/arabinose dehydrogenase
MPCVNPAVPDLSIRLEQVFTNLSFNQPLAMLQAPADNSRWMVVERPGRVRTFSNTPDVSTFATDFIDIRTRVSTAGEGGLLGMAFHPDFAANGQVFLSWTRTGNPLISIISRFNAITGATALDISSELEILRLNQDFSNHNGGHIAFGPDGFLYIGFGDGGGAGDPRERAQDTSNLPGAMLRLDVSASTAASPYTIPNDNPFAANPVHCSADPNVNTGNCPEIYAWGLRNPWRWSFDAATGALWAGDVGQNSWEEVDRIVNGGNYGWDIREGAHCHEPAINCSTAGLTDPVAEYGHALGNSITGGYVYRGSSVPGLAGSYVFGDFGSGRIWRLQENAGGRFTLDELIDSSLSISSFGQGNDGELYVTDIAGGGLYRVAPICGT